MNRPYKTPNRWMINHVPVRQERRIDWIPIFAAVILFGFCFWFAWLIWTI